MNMDAQLWKAGRRETYVVEPRTCKTGGTVRLFSREGLEDLIRRCSVTSVNNRPLNDLFPQLLVKILSI